MGCEYFQRRYFDNRVNKNDDNWAPCPVWRRALRTHQWLQTNRQSIPQKRASENGWNHDKNLNSFISHNFFTLFYFTSYFIIWFFLILFFSGCSVQWSAHCRISNFKICWVKKNDITCLLFEEQVEKKRNRLGRQCVLRPEDWTKEKIRDFQRDRQRSEQQPTDRKIRQ